MAITDDLTKLENLLNELITRYEQYFIGFEKREPLQLRAEVERLIRSYVGVPINNTMYKHRYSMLVARFNTYREHWNRILRLIEEGKYSRDRFISDLHQRERQQQGSPSNGISPGFQALPPLSSENELDRVFREYREARMACNLPVETLSREIIAATLEKHKPTLAAKLGTEDLTFRVVVENGKPKIKASKRK